jgi:hypothetical protein
VKLVTFTKEDGLPAVVNVDHVVVLFRTEEGCRIVLSNGIEIYVRTPVTEVQRQIDEATAA